MICPLCNEPALWAQWNRTHRCCSDCVAADDLDRFIERTMAALMLSKSTPKVLNWDTMEWEPLNGKATDR